jgi:hypothetical protein
MQTRSSPQHVRACVDQPELKFMLFEESENIPIIDNSALDDQLFDPNASDSDYDLPPLTPLLIGSEFRPEEEPDGKLSLA